MNVVYSSSDYFSDITGISIVSLFENNKKAKEINVFVIDNDISEENKKKLIDLKNRYNRNITFLAKPDLSKYFDFEIEVGRWNIGTFYRLFLPTILGNNVHRVLYIDGDTIIRKSLEDIFSFDLKEKVVAGVDDFRSDNYKKNIGLESSSSYVNNGFLLIDLDKWREENVEKLFADFIKTHNGNITYVDQGVLNGILGKMNLVHVLPPIYNAQRVFFDFKYNQLVKLRKPTSYCSEEEYLLATSDPTVVHFTTCFISGTRPWMRKDRHKFKSEWLHYKSLTGWKDEPFKKDDRKAKKKLMTIICKMTPKFILIPVMSLLHAKIYPWVRNLKQKRNERKQS